MPLKAYPPGTRKGNKFYIIRGRLDGKPREFATKFPAGTPRKTLNAFIAEIEQEVRAQASSSRVPRPGEGATFRRAVDLYIAAKDPRPEDIQRLDRLCAATSSDPNDERVFGEYQLVEILHPVVVDIARTMLPNCMASTLNRQVIVPVASVIHYAADEAKICPYIKLKKFKEPPPETRAVDRDTVAMIIAAAPAGPKRLLMLWLFRQGNRISEPLRITWDDIDLSQRTVRTIITKPIRRVRVKPLADEVFEMLSAVPEEARVGHLFPWKTRWGVYEWLHPLREKIGIPHFTPHMARHTLGTELNAAGVGLRTSMEALDHLSEKSTMRYTSADINVLRAALAKTYSGDKRAG